MLNITDTSIRRPVTTMMIFICLIVIGLISSRLVPLEFLPNMDENDIDINIPYPGATPDEVERLIVRPAEEVLSTISDIKQMRSNSWEGGCWVELTFDWGVNTKLKGLEAKEKMESIRHQLPDDVERIYVRQESTSDIPILNLRISSKRDLSNAYDLLNRNLKRRIERLPGVSSVNLHGVDNKEIRIELLSDRLAAHQIDMNDLSRRLSEANFSVSAGTITDGSNRFRVKPAGEFRSIGDIESLIIGKNNLRLRDIAEITYGSPTMDHGRHLDGSFAIGLEIQKEGNANTIEVTNRVKQEIDLIGELPEMQGIAIYYMDNLADGIQSSLDELFNSGMIGALLAILVLYFFLRRLGTTMIVTLAVPFSLLVTMSCLYFLDMTLNILSMMGLMLAIGMLVDNAVVVTESIHRHREINPDQRAATISGVQEVAMAVTAGTLTTAIVFLPGILSANNQIMIYLKHVSVTICIALGASLLLSQTLIPLLVSRIKYRAKEEKKTLVDALVVHYERVLTWTIRRPLVSALLIFITFISVVLPFVYMGENNLIDMFPNQEDRRLRLHYNINGHYTLEKVEETVTQIEEYLFANKEQFEIRSIYSYFQAQHASSTILLYEDEKANLSMEEIRELILKELPQTPVANPSFSWGGRGGGAQEVYVYLSGESTQRLADLAPDVVWTLSQVDGFIGVRNTAERGQEEIHVKVNRHRALQNGLSTRQVANTIATAMRGQNLRRYRGEDGEIGVRVQFKDADRQNLDNLRNLQLQGSDFRPVKLAAVADFSQQRGFQNIWRKDRITQLGIAIQLGGDLTVPAAKEKIAEALGSYNFPPGYGWDYGERFNEDDDVMNSMLINIGLALIMIYFLMAALFESLIYPAAIWSSILFAIIGVFWFFAITHTTFSLMAMIGILILIGVVVNNGIVLIDQINHLRSEGVARNQAILQAGRDRMRPILMTAGTTVLGLVPLSLATTQIGGDGPPYFPMARAIVGGLTFSTAITLLALPSIYIWMDNLRDWSRNVLRLAVGRQSVKPDLPHSLADGG